MVGQLVTQVVPSRYEPAPQDRHVMLVPAQVAQAVLQSMQAPAEENLPAVQLAVQERSEATKLRPLGQVLQLLAVGPLQVAHVGKQAAHEGLDWPPQLPVR